MSKVRLATAWLDGCSGCHMSFLDLDERLIDIADMIDVVYSPIVDLKDFPENVDVTLVEGAVSNEDDLQKIEKIRARTKLLISLGDCAVTSNVPGMRNYYRIEDLENRAYVENSDINKTAPDQVVPPLLKRSKPIHHVVDVDIFLPGCPPPADAIHHVLSELLNGRTPDVRGISRFGA